MMFVPCCGREDDYCECPQWKREKAMVLYFASLDCPPAPKLPAEAYDEPPF